MNLATPAYSMIKVAQTRGKNEQSSVNRDDNSIGVVPEEGQAMRSSAIVFPRHPPSTMKRECGLGDQVWEFNKA
ncbi:hypothetical protein L873DRAFT_1819515 [Choiromyces venosus 120613-1]|uniref:Uncharacterized protein n=1 Tax=Choiromyces venosus 120613-1 TaxID=1336337 RepID=A0A3N4IZJ9_9PEZI|nr:hypothetical protein L873DRAFT_1819515 [Choiromyces venosus 120613-1]